jgi:hypothetical protein|tara:strand:+ start:532 stop:768 length:237 start_codon:yes stop_codon:yes gene_type:complete
MEVLWFFILVGLFVVYVRWYLAKQQKFDNENEESYKAVGMNTKGPVWKFFREAQNAINLLVVFVVFVLLFLGVPGIFE